MTSVDKKLVFVIGMHRCGTSVVSHLVQELGFYLGNELMRATEHNMDGHFENMKVFFLNEQLFSDHTITWDKTYLLDNPFLHDAEDFILKAQEIISSEYANKNLISIKDPKNSFLLPLWVEAADRAGYQSMIVLCFRHPYEVAQSLQKRDDFSIEKSSIIYVDHLLQAERNSRHLPRLLVNYVDLIEHKDDLIKRLANFLSVSMTADFQQALLHNIKSQYRHQVVNDDSLSPIPMLSLKLYTLLQKICSGETLDNELESVRMAQIECKRKLFFKDDRLDIALKEVKDATIANSVLVEKGAELNHQLKGVLQEKEVLIQDIASLQFNLKKQEELVSQKDEVQKKLEEIQEIQSERINDQNNRLLSFERIVAELQVIQKDQTSRMEALQKRIEVEQSEKWVLRGEMGLLEKRGTDFKNRLEDLEFHYNYLRNSLSLKVGYAVTFLPRKIYDIIFSRSRPLSAYLSSQNIRRGIIALRTEPFSRVARNLFKYIKRIEEQGRNILVESKDVVYHIDSCFIFQNRLYVRGWIFSSQGLLSVSIINTQDEIRSHLQCNIVRSDVSLHYPFTEYSLHCGFETTLSMDSVDTEELFIEARLADVVKFKAKLAVQNGVDMDQLSLNDQYVLYMANVEPSLPKPDWSIFNASITISIVVPVYNVRADFLEECVHSVVNQTCSQWELCLYDDCSTDIETVGMLKKVATLDPRIRVFFGESNQGIALATNEAIKKCTGNYIAFLDNDDTLAIDAIAFIVEKLSINPTVKLLYSDEDKLDENGFRCDPHFKPSFNLNLLRSVNYICHFLVVERLVGERISWLRAGVDGAQDYDFILRVIDAIDEKQVYRIPRVLYHWRKHEKSTSFNLDVKSSVIEASVKAISDHLHRRNVEAEVRQSSVVGQFALKYQRSNNPSVDIIIPFFNNLDVLSQCVQSIINKTEYQNYSLKLVSNNSTDPKLFEYLDQLSSKYHNVHWFKYDVPFNYSQINNWAVKQSEAELVLLLNDDTEVINSQWLDNMVGELQDKQVAVVGAKLLYHDNRIQHAGVVLGIGGVAGHAHKKVRDEDHGYFNRHQVRQNVTAVTAACMLTRRSVFIKVGGLDEAELKVAFNDIDYCLKVRALGYDIVYTPEAILYHYESVSRKSDELPENYERFRNEVNFFKKRWAKELKAGDPFFNPNFNLNKEQLSIRCE